MPRNKSLERTRERDPQLGVMQANQAAARWFFLVMLFVKAAAVAYGFSFTIGDNVRDARLNC